MTKLTFENAAFADVVSRVASAAPTSGAQLEISPGIVISYEFNDAFQATGEVGMTTLRATNGELYYREWASPLAAEGESINWQVSSLRLAAVTAALPIGSNKMVSVSDEYPGFLYLKSGSVEVRLPLLGNVEMFPQWPVFDPASVSVVPGFSDIISRVAWAAGEGALVPYNGLHFDGSYAVATDRYRMSTMPCVLPAEEPFTVPAAVLTGLLKKGDSASAAFYGGHLYIMPNEHVQIMVVNYGVPYVKWQAIAALRSQTQSFNVAKAELAAMVKRVKALVRGERQSVIQVRIGSGKMMIAAQDSQNSKIRDMMDLDGSAEHAPVNYFFQPDNFLQAIENAPGDTVDVAYWDDPSGKIPMWRFSSAAGYEVWLSPRHNITQLGDQ